MLATTIIEWQYQRQLKDEPDAADEARRGLPRWASTPSNTATSGADRTGADEENVSDTN